MKIYFQHSTPAERKPHICKKSQCMCIILRQELATDPLHLRKPGFKADFMGEFLRPRSGLLLSPWQISRHSRC